MFLTPRRAIIALTLLMLVGCSSVTPVNSPPASAPSAGPVIWPSDTVYGRLFAQIQPDGSVSKDVALEAFSTAIAPLPGVPVAPGGPPQDFERADGTFAIDWLMPYLDQLTPEQQAAVAAALKPSADAQLVEPARPVAEVGGADVAPVVAVNDPAAQPYVDAINYAISEIPKRLGRTLKAKVDFDFSPTAPAKAPNALAYSFRGSTAGTGRCEVRSTPNITGAEAVRIKVAMAHEVFHCFQYEVWKSGDANDWVIEGQAEWAGEDIAGPGPDGLKWWEMYVDTPNYSLFKDTYEAVGFYEHLKEIGINPWTIFDAMLKVQSDDVAAFKAAHADTDGFLSTWASGRRTDLQPTAWYAHGRWDTDEHTSPEKIHVANGDKPEIKAAQATNSLYLVLTTADITEINVDNGNGRVLTGGADVPDVQQIDLCTKGPTTDACNCPDGFDYDGPTLAPSDGSIWIGLSGGLTGASGTVNGLDLTPLCKPKPSTKPGAPRGGPNPCANGCAGSIGDPHLETVDQQQYEFQAAGEYTLLRSPDGSMEIQGRQVPYPDIPDVSITTALAWKVAGHRVAMYANQGSATYSLTLDGNVLDPQALVTTDLGSGSALTAMADGVEVAYGDGTISTVLFHGNGFAQALDIQIAPSPDFRVQAIGLLGPIAAGSELPALPDGTALPLSQVRATQFAQRYQQFAPAWHVTDQTSLFDYQPGETTATFDVPDFPTQGVAFSVDELEQNQQDAAAVQNANDACVGADGQPETLQHCIFDILATKDPNYAQFYALLGQFLANGPAVLAGPVYEVTAPPAPTPSTNLPAGFVQVAADVSLIKGATIGSDGMLYASIQKPDDSSALVSVDTTSGAPGPTITTTGSGGLFLLDGSLWLAQDDPTGANQCSLERLDPATLAQQASIPVGCDLSGVQARPVADGVWWLDRTTADGDGHGGMIRHIDPATNAVDRSVEVPFVNGYMGSSASTVIFGSSDEGSGWFRLLPGATSFTPVTLPSQTFGLYAQGEGIWFQPAGSLGATSEADFYTSSATPDKTISIDGIMTGADDQAIYVDGSSSDPDELMRYAFDGSAPTPVLSGATLTTANGDHDLTYFDNDPFVIANQRIAKLWLVQDWPTAGSTAVIAQAAGLP